MNISLKNNRGNALILILVATLLFGALTYAFMGTKGSSQGTMDKERAASGASQLIAYMQNLRNGVDKMLLDGHCLESEQDYGTSDWLTIAGGATTAVNGSARADGTCSLFGIKGGGQVAKIWSNSANNLDYPQSTTTAPKAGHGIITMAKVYNIGSDKPDLIYIVPGLNLNVCKQLYKQAGITETSTTSGVNDDCFTWGTGPSDVNYAPTGSNTIGEAGTLPGHKVFAGYCSTSGSSLAASSNTCYAGIVLIER